MKDTKPITRNSPPRMATAAAGLLVWSAAFAPTAKAQLIFTEAITREVTVFNKLPTPPPNEAISREMTLLNNLSGVMLHLFGDAITREVTVFNSLPTFATDANTREVTLFNKLASLAAISDASTREFTILNTILCTGDFNNDFAVTVADIPLFAAVMTDPNPHLAALQAADLNCDGITNGIDVQAFVDALLAP